MLLATSVGAVVVVVVVVVVGVVVVVVAAEIVRVFESYPVALAVTKVADVLGNVAVKAVELSPAGMVTVGGSVTPVSITVSALLSVPPPEGCAVIRIACWFPTRGPMVVSVSVPGVGGAVGVGGAL